MKKLFLMMAGCLVFLTGTLYSDDLYLRLSKPLNGWSSDRIITIKGQTNVPSKTVKVVYNGLAFLLPVADGSFERNFIASPGQNNIYAEVQGEGEVYSDKVSFFSKAPAKGLKILLVWDTDNTDVDLWVTEPSGEKSYYGYRNTKDGGSLDVDVTTGYGPEVYTIASPVKGSYLIQVNYYSDNGYPQSQLKIYAVLYEGTPNEVIKEYEAVLTKTGEVVTIDSVLVE
ncbi:MAG TPA: hypothetical protein DHW82_13615 [Spirochaetia bacterium]|nr:MAG: hypothetical protein A2Y41_08855 [Spirochaetes bacterium GWB1_36_13]HCL58027.1 hypothetical protein [Spirochaetia bacterium]